MPPEGAPLRPDLAPERIESPADLATLLQRLRRRDARRRGRSERSCRELAAATSWSHATIAYYLAGRIVPPTERFDILVRLLGASPAEQRALASARDRVEEHQRASARGTAPANGAARSGEELIVPRQLPLAIQHFTGRTDELRALSAYMHQATNAVAVPIVTISGTAGVGKTALVLHWAHQVADRFGDGQLYVNLRGFDGTGLPMTAAEAVRGFIDALGLPRQQVPVGLDAQVALYRSLLAGRRVLVVLDNAHDASQVRPLLPGAAGCVAVVTSRNRLSGLVALEGALPVTLGVPTAAQARQLLTRRLGVDRVAAEPQAVDDIIARCARLPLALTIVAARAATHPRFPLSVLTGELADTHAALDVLSGGDADTDVRNVFSWSYQRLRPGAARLFRLLGLHPDPQIGVTAWASLAGLPREQVQPALTELVGAHLVTEHTPGRYALHDLLHAYATELAHLHDPEVERRRALHRMFDHYLHAAHAASALLEPYGELIALPPAQPRVTPETLADHGEAVRWFTVEQPVLLAVTRRAARAGFPAHTWQLAVTMSSFLDRQGHWDTWAATHLDALDAAVSLADRSGQAVACRGLGCAFMRLGRLDEAHTHLQDALERYGELGDHAGKARTHVDLAMVLERQRHYQQALGHMRQALELFRATGHRIGQANALNGVGWYHILLGNHEPALTYCDQAVLLFHQEGHRRGEAGSWDSLGYAHHHLGHYQQAVGCYQHALALTDEVGDRYNQAQVLTRLGDTQHAAGSTAAAKDSWQHALNILTEFGDSDAEQVCARLHQPED
jgi:tetratricopeptide (TPR) repeat protein